MLYERVNVLKLLGELIKTRSSHPLSLEKVFHFHFMWMKENEVEVKSG